MTEKNKTAQVVETLDGSVERTDKGSSSAHISPRFNNLPDELKKVDRWVLWRYERNATPGKKPRKIPYSLTGRAASSTDPTTWAALDATETEYLFGDYSGVGIVLNGDRLVGVDLDHCVTDGIPMPAALAILEQLGANYIETSPSGTGLRALGYGPEIVGTTGEVNGINVELYSNGRYLTLTGQTLKREPLAPLTGFLELATQMRGKPTSVKVEATDDISDLQPAASDRTLTDLKSALMYLASKHHGKSNQDWTNIGQALKAESRHGRESEIKVLWLEYSRACGGYKDDNDVENQWGKLAGAKTGKGAIFQKAQNLGWINPATGKVTTNSSRYKLLSGTDLRNLPPMVWRVHGALPAVGLASIYGPSKAGKSFLCIDLACAIAEGNEWFRHRVTPAPVVYVALEGEAGFRQRAGAWEVKNGRALPDGFKMVMQPFNLTTAQDIADLASVVPTGAVVFLDTLRRAAPTADENASKDMGEIIEGAKRLMVAINGLVIVVHHTGKNESQGMRGHSSLLGALDASIEVSREGDRRSWKSDKVKEGEDGGISPFKLEIVNVGFDDDNEMITSCVVVTDTSTLTREMKALKHVESVVLETLIKVLATNGFTAPNTVPHDAPLFDNSLRVVPEQLWKQACYEAGITNPSATPDAKLKAFKRARGELLSRNLIQISSGYAWKV